MIAMPRSLRLWGVVGALLAAVFAVWMLLFPQFIPTAFAWNAQPRAAQAFIGAGYLFRTYFFLLFVFVPDWRLLRWTYYGNLLFTGTLLLATLWHAPEVHWLTVTAHIWIVFYTLEPVIMHFTIPRAGERPEEPVTSGGPISSLFRWFLILEVGIAMLFGLALVINPEWLNTRWPWELNPFDARIVAAWWLGSAGWVGSMVRAHDWDEVRLGAIGNLILTAALTVASVVFLPYFNHTHPTVQPYIIGMAVLSLGLAFFIWQHERRRPARAGASDRREIEGVRHIGQL
jgi:hypothetical protein